MNNKSVLLVVPKFEPLHSQIITCLKELDYKVDVIYDNCQPYNPYTRHGSFKIIRKIIYKICNLNKRYHRNVKNWDYRYDILLCINGWSMEDTFINRLTQANPNIKKILYLWDCLHVFKFERLFNKFDTVYTFDPKDAETYNLNYYPLFWTPQENKDNTENIKYDLSFIGKFHSDRYEFFNKIRNIAFSNNLKLFIKIVITDRQSFVKELINHLLFKLNSKFAIDYRFNFIMNKIKDEIIVYDYVKSNEVRRITLESNCILDIQLPYQSGLTNRAIQTLGSGKKLITTNKYILNDPYFYNDPNICIVDRINPILKENFLKTPVVQDVSYIKHITQFRIDNWIKHILSNY